MGGGGGEKVNLVIDFGYSYALAKQNKIAVSGIRQVKQDLLSGSCKKVLG